jgi:poly(beta-D-mannuronate) lyase
MLASSRPHRCLRWLPVLCLAGATEARAASTRVTSISALQSAINTAGPGDTLTLADGSYSASGITIGRAGTASAPITITAETVGGATIAGSGGFRFTGTAAYVVVRGFRLTHSGAVETAVGSHHCRISRNHFQRSGGGQHLVMYGFDHEVDYNRFQDRANSPTITLDKNLSDSWPTHNNTSRIYIHHNHFLRSSNTAGNGGESIQTWAGFTRAEQNLFEETNGDPEVISSKASDSIYRYNTFRNITRGQLVLRYARRCTIDGNFFFNAQGIRIHGDNHKVRNNYLESSKTIVIADGKSGYLPVVNVEVSFNTLVNSTISSQSGDTPPTSTRVANNIVQADSGTLVSHRGSITFEGNILWGAAANGTLPASGFRRVDPELVRNGNGVLHLGPSSPAIDSAAGSYALGDDLDGQPRSGAKDVGADEVVDTPAERRALTSGDVGPAAGSSPTPTPTSTPTRTPTPTATPTPTPTATLPPGIDVEITPAGAGVTASTHDGNVPANSVDDSLATRWSANGNGQWIQYDLGAPRTVASVKAAWYQGTGGRRTTFDLWIGSGATGPWTSLLTGAQSSGTTTALETYEVADTNGRYLRIVGHGNTANTWNSITEVQIWGR